MRVCGIQNRPKICPAGIEGEPVDGDEAVVRLADAVKLDGRGHRALVVVLPLPPDDQQKITAQLGPGVVGNALPSKTIQDPSVYFPLQDKALTYQVTGGPNSGTQTLGLVRAARPSRKLAWRFQLTPTLAGFLRQTPEGELRRVSSAIPRSLCGWDQRW